MKRPKAYYEVVITPVNPPYEQQARWVAHFVPADSSTREVIGKDISDDMDRAERHARARVDAHKALRRDAERRRAAQETQTRRFTIDA